MSGRDPRSDAPGARSPATQVDGAAGPHPAAQRDPNQFAPRLVGRRRWGVAFQVICLVATLVGVVVLALLLVDIIMDGAGRLSLAFLDNFPSRFADRSGVKPALWGSAWALLLTVVIAFPLGVGTAIWLEEYAPDNRFTRLVETNIANLAGVPSIVYGILGLALFVRAMAMGRTLLAAGATLALLILPVIVVASQEALKAVPGSIRLGAYALGATRWEAVRYHVFPLALPGILTGTILALSRAVGETAPVIMVGALAFMSYVPDHPLDDGFTVLPFQLYSWVAKPGADFQELAAATGIVLLVLLLVMNGGAIYLRNKFTGER